MTARALWFALSRPSVWLPAALGAGLLAGDVTTVGGVLLLVFGGIRLRRVLGYRDLDQRLRLRGEKRAHGIGRRFDRGERTELLALDEYCASLRGSGAGSGLGDEVMEQAWGVLRGKPADSAARLKHLRQSLPPIPEAGPATGADPRVGERIQEELDLLRATRKEVEQVGG